MQKNKGISLIVLVITIIVMIILAGSIILSLSNNGIIGKANEAVDATNEATVRQLVELKWAEAYLDKNIQTDTQYYKYVTDALIKEGINTSAYDIKVTTVGATVEKLMTIAELQSKYEFKYYSSLRLAIEDVNLGTVGKENSKADEDKTNAVAGVYIENGKITVVLLKDTEENSRLDPTTDMTINLGGNELNFIGEDVVGINGTLDRTDTIIIDGRLEGSKIKVKGTTRGSILFQPRTNTFIINGGTYIANTVEDIGTTDEYTVCAVFARQTGNTYLNNATIITNMNVVSKGESILDNKWMHICGVMVQDEANLYINNSSINVNVLGGKEYKLPMIKGIHNANTGDTVIQGSEIIIKSNVKAINRELEVHGCVNNQDSKLKLNESLIKLIVEDVEKFDTSGVSNYGELWMNNSVIEMLPSGKYVGFHNNNSGVAKLNSCIITGANSTISNDGKLYIDDVEYTQ